MNLIIDQGNTAIKLALFEGDSLLQKRSFDNTGKQEAQDWIAENQRKITQIAISNVSDWDIPVPRDIPVLHIHALQPLPVHMDYQSPQTLGNDRLANACAIWKLNPSRTSLAIDLGTCIKYDLVLANGHYIGGAISPGYAMRFQSLHTFTARLPLLSADVNSKSLGTDTQSSLSAGVKFGIIHEINGFIERYKQDFGDLTIFMTGGDLNYFDKEFKNPIFANPDLTLIGLNEILQHYAQQK